MVLSFSPLYLDLCSTLLTHSTANGVIGCLFGHLPFVSILDLF
jgi:hypothetical protein